MFRSDVLLYVEDDSGFVDLFNIALKRGNFPHQVIHLSDGEQAITYLLGIGKYGDREKYPLPCVVLLDLRMPRLDGFAVLDWIRNSSQFPYLPVVMLTVSEEVHDISHAYSAGANSFLVKPPHVDDLKELLVSLERYWFRQNVPEQYRELGKHAASIARI